MGISSFATRKKINNGQIQQKAGTVVSLLDVEIWTSYQLTLALVQVLLSALRPLQFSKVIVPYGMIGSLSKDDGHGNEDVILKYNFSFS